ncbi:hypothetical protein [Salinicola halophilus]|uniref:hypothetical protein n=1 Tax=Salinicola halophilus TaxID=184065 RepID=UPI0013A63A78|nr:hypothetical protein [Salinicola halophilus]
MRLKTRCIGRERVVEQRLTTNFDILMAIDEVVSRLADTIAPFTGKVVTDAISVHVVGITLIDGDLRLAA